MVRAHAAHAIGHLGPAALPVIAELAPLVADADATVRRTAIRTWARIHPAPAVSIPLLEKVLKEADPTVRAEALEIMAEIGKPAVPALIQALGHEKTVYWACLVLGEIGPDAAEGAPALAEALALESSAGSAREAALALGSIGPAAARATPALSNVLDDGTVSVVAAAAFALGRDRPGGQVGRAGAGKTRRQFRSSAANDQHLVLAKIEPRNEARQLEAAPLLAAALGSRQPQVRRAAARGLADLKPAPGLVLPAIKNALANPDMAVATNAVEALALLGEAALPALIDGAEDRADPSRRGKSSREDGPAGEAGRAGPGGDRGPRRLRSGVLRGPDGLGGDRSRRRGVGAGRGQGARGNKRGRLLCGLLCPGANGPGGHRRGTSVAEETRRPERDDCPVGGLGAGRIDPTSAEIARQSVPLLIKGLADTEPRVRTEAAVSLGRLGPLAKDAAPARRRASRHGRDGARGGGEGPQGDRRVTRINGNWE